MANSPAAYLEDSRLIIRASSLDRCQRCLVGLALGFTPMKEPEKALGYYTRGHRVEDEVIPILKEKGFYIANRQVRVELTVGDKAVIRGHIDGSGYPPDWTDTHGVVIEIKSCAPTSWDAWTTGRWATWDKWEWQTSVYGHATGLPVHLIAAQVIDGQWTGVLDHYTIPEPRIPLSRIHARVLDIQRYVDEGRLPATCSSHDWPCPLYHLCSQPEIPPDIDPALDSLATHLDKVRSDRKQLEGVEKEIRSRIDELLGERDKVRTDTWSVTRVDQARTTLDKDKLEEAFGDLSAYEKVTFSQQLRVTKRKDGGRGGIEASGGSVGAADTGEDRADRGSGHREDAGGDADRRTLPTDERDENVLPNRDRSISGDRTVSGDDTLQPEER